MPNENMGVGSNTAPIVQLVERSGLRAGLPPSLVVNCALQSRKLPVDGQRSGSVQLPPVAPKIAGWSSSISVGARKPVPHDPRTRTSLAGCQRSETLGLVVLPTS